eukprot:1151889-Pelagomonas_calceolata.AAC.8
MQVRTYVAYGTGQISVEMNACTQMRSAGLAAIISDEPTLPIFILKEACLETGMQITGKDAQPPPELLIFVLSAPHSCA